MPFRRRPDHCSRTSIALAALAVLMGTSCQHGGSHFHDAAPSGRLPFRDAAASAGINFRHNNGATGQFYYIEATGSGCAFLDYDNDGFLDVLLVQSGPVVRTRSNDPPRWCRLYHNQGDGTFKDVTAGSGLDQDLGYGQGVAIGDYDNDGYDDIFITGYGGNHLLHNEHGSGRFQDVTARSGLSDTEHGPQYATSASFGDYDNDGYLDLYVCHYAPWTIAKNQHCARAASGPDYCSPSVYAPVVHRLYHNNRHGKFTDVTTSSGIGSHTGRGLVVAWLDYDGDGKSDIYVGNDIGAAFLWHNEGHGKFVERAMEAGCAFDRDGNAMAAMGLGLGDYDNSGRESLFVSNFSGLPNSLFHNIGGGQFADVSVAAGVAQPHMKFLSFGNDFIDYDADGWKDLIVANGHVEVHAEETFPGTTYREPKQLFHNDGNGKFTEVLQNRGDLATPVVSRGLCTGDYDNDGRVDFLVNNQNGLAQLFHNEDSSGNHWISFRTVGARSNRDGYGAHLFVTCGTRRLTSEVHSSTSYASHGDSRVYFGLGKSTRVDRLEIRWPGGTHEFLKDIPADSSYTLTEGKGLTARAAVRQGWKPWRLVSTKSGA